MAARRRQLGGPEIDDVLAALDGTPVSGPRWPTRPPRSRVIDEAYRA